MQLQRVNRTDAEKVFIIVKCVSASSLTTGYGVAFCGGAVGNVASADGVGAVLATDALMLQFAGVAAQDIAVNGYGRVQAWGYCGSIAFSPSTDKTIGPGSILRCGAAGYGFDSTQTPQAVSTFLYKYVISWTTVNVSGGIPYGPGFVRAL